MDEGLFVKHITLLRGTKKVQEEILLYIQEKTGILLQEEEIQIRKKKIHLRTSSVKRNNLIQKNIQIILQEKGFTLVV